MTERSIQYLRSPSPEEALTLKEQFGEKAQLLFGGNFQPKLEEGVEVLIDLQDTSFDEVESTDSGLRFGGLITLNYLAEILDLADFSEALSIEFGLNVRNSLSLSNFLAHTSGRSPVLCCLEALGASVITLKHPEEVALFQYIFERKQDDPVLNLLLTEPTGLAFESVGRSPKDLPIVCVAAAKTEDGAIRVAAGGSVQVLPGFTIASFDEDGQNEIKAALSGAEDQWASAEYRREVGAILLSRALQKLHLRAAKQEAR